MLEFALVEGFDGMTSFGEGLVWLEAMPARLYHTPQYGEVAMPVEKLDKMVAGFKANVRGQEIAINFDHGEDKAKGNKAAGWYKDFAVKPSSNDPQQMSLYAAVEFTEEASKEVRDKQWKYFSLEWDDQWMDNSGNNHQDVIVGGALTNRPVAKDMAALPINFSEAKWNELSDDDKKEFTKIINKQRARTRSLEVAKTNKMSEEVIKEIEAGSLVLVDEVREWEHSEPGTGPAPAIGDPEQPDPGTGQPVPRTTGNPADDPAIGGGWRRDPLPLDPSDPNAPKGEKDKRDEGGSVLTPEELTELRKKLELGEDAPVVDIIAAAGKAFSESKTMAELTNAVDEEKKFSEQYPAMHAEHVRMREAGNISRAKEFSESVATLKRPEGENMIPTKNGLSALALDKVQEVHKAFSEGKATITQFEDVIKTITQGGIVVFGEEGSSIPPEPVVIDTSNAEGIANTRKLFAEKVAEIQKKDELSLTAAMAEAAKQYPDLASAYRATAAA